MSESALADADGVAAPRERRALTPILLVLPAALFLALFLLAPVVNLGLTGFWRTEFFEVIHDWNLDQFRIAWQQEGVVPTLLRSLWIGLIVAVITVALAYPIAHFLRFRARAWKAPLLAFVVTALFSGYLVKIYAWRTLMGREGAINWLLERIGVIDEPLLFLFYNRFAVIVTLVHIFLPFAILLLLAALEGVDVDLLEAPRVLGAKLHHVVLLVVLPLIGRSVFAAFAFVFVLAAGDYVTPQFVGGTSGSMVGVFISIQLLQNGEYSRGSALSLIFLLAMILVVCAVYLAGKLAHRALRAA